MRTAKSSRHRRNPLPLGSREHEGSLSSSKSKSGLRPRDLARRSVIEAFMAVITTNGMRKVGGLCARVAGRSRPWTAAVAAMAAVLCLGAWDASRVPGPYETGAKLPGGYVVADVSVSEEGHRVVTIEGGMGRVQIRLVPRDEPGPAFARAGRCDVTYEAGSGSGVKTPEDLAEAVNAVAREAARADPICAPRAGSQRADRAAVIVALVVVAALGGLAFCLWRQPGGRRRRAAAWLAAGAMAIAAAAGIWFFARGCVSPPPAFRDEPRDVSADTGGGDEGAMPTQATSGEEAFDIFIAKLLRLAENRDPAGIDDLLSTTWRDIRERAPGIAPESEAALQTRTRLWLTGWARCQVLASRDPSWCGMLDGLLPDETHKCKAVTSMWVLVGDEVVRKGGSCAAIQGRTKWHFSNLEGHGPAFCAAISERRPELCPDDFDGTPGSPICEVAAGRPVGEICAADPDRPGWWAACCTLFGERFAAFLDPAATFATSPELGALSGDAAGCARALEEGLGKDLGFLFGMGAFPELLSQVVVGGQAACRPLVPWSPGDAGTHGAP